MGATALAAGGLSVFGTIAAIGGIVGGIGALTGNETMMKIGMVAGLAGGIGSFAQGQGWLASADAATTANGATSGISNTQALSQTAAPGVESSAQLADAGAWEAGFEGTSALGGETAGLAAGMESGIAQNLTATNPLASESTGLFNAGANPTDLRLQDGIQSSPLAAEAATAVEPVANLNTSLGGQNGLNGSDVMSDRFDLNGAKGAGGFGGGAGAEGGGILDVFKKAGSFWKDMDKETKSMLGNFVGGAFDKEKAAKADYYASAAEIARQRMANGSAVPNMGFKLKQPASGSIWKPTSPTYNAPRPSGLYYAK
jgi:hypothetical protein